jgi:hypothetical protein
MNQYVQKLNDFHITIHTNQSVKKLSRKTPEHLEKIHHPNQLFLSEASPNSKKREDELLEESCYCLLGCDTMYWCGWITRFQRTMLPPSSEWGGVVLQNTHILPHHYMVSQPRRLWLDSLSLWWPQVSQLIQEWIWTDNQIPYKNGLLTHITQKHSKGSTSMPPNHP